MDKPYHHGNLKCELLEAGIRLILQEGETGFSLRKVAALCDVSHAAPYGHFRNKEEMLSEMQAYVTAQFMDTLEETLRENASKADSERLVQLGKAYVLFFLRHPQYFSFLFSQPCMKIDLSVTADGGDDFPPFRLFRGVALRALGRMGYEGERARDAVISLWAQVQGLASIVTMKHVRFDRNWEDKLEDLLRNARG